MTDVLFVDDDAFILNALKRLMRRETFSFRTAGSGREALDILESEPIAVIISDYMMPGMNGVELLDIAQKRWPHTIRAILSGYSDKEVIDAALATHVISMYLLKPWEDEKLRETVRKLVQQSRVINNGNLRGEGI